MPIPDAHPEAVKLDAAFAAAMDTPGKPREPGPPPEVDRDAPFGRDDGGAPLAPFGLTRDGKPKKSPAGRKPAGDDKARVGETPDPGKDKKAEAAIPGTPVKYAPAIAESLETFWIGGTVLGQVGPDLPVVGKFIPGVRLQAQAAVLLAFQDNIATAIDICAQHNEQARRLAVKLSAGGAGWALNAAFMILPFVSTSLQVWGKEEREFDPETNEPLPTLTEKLVEQNQANFNAYLEKMATAAAEAAQVQQGSPNGSQPVPAAA